MKTFFYTKILIQQLSWEKSYFVLIAPHAIFINILKVSLYRDISQKCILCFTEKKKEMRVSKCRFSFLVKYNFIKVNLYKYLFPVLWMLLFVTDPNIKPLK